MALGLELKLRMGMQLVMTPQLQMAIRLLQMSNLELTEYLQEELERNPLLEQMEEGEEDAPSLTQPLGDLPASKESSLDDLAPSERELPPVSDDRATTETRLSDDLPVDADWTDIYSDSYGPGGSFDPSSGEAPPLENTLAKNGSLTDHLLWQLGLSARDERERSIGETIIDAIDDNGYLSQPLESLASISGVDVEDVEDALILVQSFEPAGVGARDLRECLLLQLKNMKLAVPPYSTLLDHLDDLARRDFRKLARVLRLNDEQLADAVEVLHELNPKPGLAFGSDQATYVAPDVYVRKLDGQWVVEINPDTVPRLRINKYYQDMANRSQSANDRRFLTENARSAQWLIKSLEQRSTTIFRVAESIVKFQEEFLEKGPEYLKPLILKDVAEDIGVHESTTSRVTSNKYIHTPRGIFELKYFFSSSLASNTGEAHSSEAVKFKIRKLVDSEPIKRPFSDEKLAQLLQEQGINVARRTVAKYREALGIASSSRRKQLGSAG
ncbi:MAG: RNA polymerase factor sigma-54 [Magnetococcus sp. WYHC-3]